MEEYGYAKLLISWLEELMVAEMEKGGMPYWYTEPADWPGGVSIDREMPLPRSTLF